MDADLLVEHPRLGLGLTLPQKPWTPRAYVRVKFRNGGEYTVRLSELEVCGP